MDASAISEALQFYLGSIYVNDLTIFGKPFQVTAQADGPFRARADDILRLQTRNRRAKWCRLAALVDLREVNAPSRVIRYNLLPAAELNASPARDYSTGQTIKAMEELADETLPANYGYEWTETARQELIAGNSVAIRVSCLCHLLGFS